MTHPSVRDVFADWLRFAQVEQVDGPAESTGVSGDELIIFKTNDGKEVAIQRKSLYLTDVGDVDGLETGNVFEGKISFEYPT